MSKHNAKHLAGLELLQIFVQPLPSFLDVDNLFPSKFKNSFAGNVVWQNITSFCFQHRWKMMQWKTILSSL
jgi:hypothetical protein